METATFPDPAYSDPVAEPDPSAEESDPKGPVAAAPPVRPREAFRRFWPWVRQDRLWLPAAILLLLTGAFGEVVSVWLFKDLIDQVLVPHRFSAFWAPAGTMAATAVVSALLIFAGNYTITWVAERFILRLRTSVVAHLHGLPPDTLDRRQRGDVVARLTGDIAAIEQLVATGVVEAGSAVLSLLLFGAAAFYLSWQLALAALAVAPVFWLSGRYFGNRILIREREARRRGGAVTAVLEESLRNAAIAGTCNQERREVAKVHRTGRALLESELSIARYAGLYPPVLNVLEVLGGLTVVGIGAVELDRGVLSLGGLLAFAAFMAQLFEPAQRISELLPVAGAAGAAGERVLELLDTPSPVVERPHAHGTGPVAGRVSCEDVRVGYPGQDGRPVLENLSFDIGPGTILAVMGPSGCGKSTLAKLLVRFLDPDSGTVRLDQHDLRDLKLASLRQAVTLLPQQAPLFHATIRDNIAYGRPSASLDEVVQAAKDADAHEFITALNEGYRTEIGRDGFQLSGGQTQRIAIARAFLRATPVLILDEPTTGLDEQSAANVIAPLRRLMAGRTTILITHDQKLARTADAVLMLGAAGKPGLPGSVQPVS
ncbi:MULTISPECIES: ABC transporter ATP-binding protein [Kitasatospora]|uniref:ABC transporter ATP-binding protein n=1 Tax=Kitasatospora cystarginea TaxID=58350 RepID=A0ABN3ETE1_9ACTN